MVEERPARETREDELRFRLDAGGFVLERNETDIGSGYMVRNSRGDVVFGAHPRSHSATLDQVENFLIAQEL